MFSDWKLWEPQPGWPRRPPRYRRGGTGKRGRESALHHPRHPDTQGQVRFRWQGEPQVSGPVQNIEIEGFNWFTKIFTTTRPPIKTYSNSQQPDLSVWEDLFRVLNHRTFSHRTFKFRMISIHNFNLNWFYNNQTWQLSVIWMDSLVRNMNIRICVSR